MVVLVVDLKNSIIREEECERDGSHLSIARSLHSSFGHESLVLSSSGHGDDGNPFLTWSIVYTSEISGKEEITTVSSPHGYSLFRLGIEALVITGRADKLRYITLAPSKKEILPIENMRGESSIDFESVVVSLSEIAISTSIASDKGVWFGSVQFRGKNLPGLGLGHAFYSHNLKGIVFSAFSDGPHYQGNEKKVENNKFVRLVRANGEYVVLTAANRLGWAMINNYSDRFDPRMKNLDGISITERFGNYPSGCPGCPLSCLRRTKDGESLPSWRDILFLGTNIGFFESGNIDKIYRAAIHYGLEIPTLGAIMSCLLSLDEEERKEYFPHHDTESMIQFIKKVATGSLFPKGLVSLPGAVQGYDHRPVYFDLRGAYTEAILLSQGLDFILPATLYFPKKRVSPRVAAIYALYETIYMLALREKGYPTSLVSAIYWSNVPQIAFSSPFFARFYLSRYSAYGLKAEELLPLGFSILESMKLEWHPIPSHFIYESSSALDSETVPLKELQYYYDEEKLRLFIKLKSRRDTSSRPDSLKSRNEGPVDDLGRETDPGLAK